MGARLFARALRDGGTSVSDLARKLSIKAGKNPGRDPSVASVYRALNTHHERQEQPPG